MALPPRPRAATLGQQHAGRNRELPPGSVVLGRYTVQKVLGRGGMATVYLAKHQQTDRLVALKLLDPEISKDPAYVERFRREAKAAGRIRSDFVVAIYDLDAEVGGSLVLVMEYLEGQSVQQALKAGRMPIQRALSFGRQMLEGLAAAHEAGVIHRDLKPANLFIEKSTTGSEKVKLLDFGISKLADASQQELTRDGQTLGTVAYMAPEQIRGKAVPSDGRVDLYSAGVSLFIMLTGKRPIDAEDTVQLLAAVLEHPPLTLANATGLPFPAPIEKFIAKALEKDPNRRFQTAIEMRDALVEAGKAVGYEQTGPLNLPSKNPEPSGVVRSPAKPAPMQGPPMGPGPAMPQPQAAPPQSAGGYVPKQTMMGVGPSPAANMGAPPTMPPAEVPQMQPPMPMVQAYPGQQPGQQQAPAYDPFGPMPNNMAPPPTAALAPVGYAAPALPAEPAPAKKSNAPMLIVLSAVGLVALGGAGAIVMKSMNAQPAMTRRVVDTANAPSTQNSNNNSNNSNNTGNQQANANPTPAQNGTAGGGANTAENANAGSAAQTAPTNTPDPAQAAQAAATAAQAAATAAAAAANANAPTGNGAAPAANPPTNPPANPPSGAGSVVVHNSVPANTAPIAAAQPNTQPANAGSTARGTNSARVIAPSSTAQAGSSGSSSSGGSSSGSRNTTGRNTGSGSANSAIADIFGSPTTNTRPAANTTGSSGSASRNSGSSTSSAGSSSSGTHSTSTGRRPPRGGNTPVVPF